MKIVVLDDYQGVALSSADWSQVEQRADIVVLRDHISDEHELLHRLAGAEVLVLMRERTAISGELLASLPSLELIVTTGPTNAALDVAGARAQGITVCGTGGSIQPTVELTWGLILAVTHHIAAEAQSVRQGGWQGAVGHDVHGRTLGVVGLGRIGSRVAHIAASFGMDVVAWSQNLSDDRAREAGVRRVTKETLFASADVVTIHLALSPRTRGLVGGRELEMMKRSAFLVNTSRGPIVDEKALIAALSERRIAGAGLDVFEDEPLPGDHPFRTLPNVVATPHIGYVTQDCYAIFYHDIVEDILAFMAGAPIREVVP